MERNAHRLTLHSPAGVILHLTGPLFIDFAQLKERFVLRKTEKSVNLQPFTTMQPPCNTTDQNN